MNKAHLFTVIALVVSCTTFGQNKVGKVKRQDKITESQVLEKIENLKTSMLQADTISWTNLIADDFIFTGSKGEFSETSKSKVLNWFKSGAIKFSSYKNEEIKIKIFDNTAIVTSIESIDGIANGENFKAHVRSTMIWIKQKGLLQLVAQQRTTTPQ